MQTPSFYLELLAYAALLAWLARRPGLSAAWRALGAGRRLLLALLVAAPLVGQVIHHDAWSYPWVGWAMYTEPVPGDVTYLEYTAVLASGREVEWPVARLFSRIGKKVTWRLRLLENAGRTELVDVILRDLAARYSREHAADPVERLRIWRCVMPVTAGGAAPAPRRTLLRELPVMVAAVPATSGPAAGGRP